MSTQGYKEASKRTAPKKGTLGKALWAFVSGGVMGIIGQGLLTMYQQPVSYTHLLLVFMEDGQERDMDAAGDGAGDRRCAGQSDRPRGVSLCPGFS